MKKSRSILLVLLSAVFALCVFAFTACTPENQGGGDTEVKVSIAPATLSLTVGGAAADVTATVENSQEKVTWSSNKPNIATVAADATDGNKAKVTAVAAGDAVITAKIGDKTATCRVTVTGAQQSVNVALDKSYLTLGVGGAAGTLNATVTGSSDKVTWAVDKSNVATITPNGNSVTVTPVAAGTAKVTATLGDITRTCNVTVNPETVVVKNGENAISKLYLNMTDATTATLTAVGSGGSAVTAWTSSDTDIVTVENGAVTAVAVGYAVVTAKVSDTVKAELPVWVTPDDYTLENGENGPTMPDDKWIEWHDQANWVGATVTLTEHKFADNAATVTYTATGACDYGVQLFYNVSAHDDRTAHKVTLTISSVKALTAIVNGTEVELAANTPETVTVEFIEGLNRKGGQTASISIQIPVKNDSVANTVTVSDVIMEDLPQTALTTPTDLAVSSEKVVTFTPCAAEEELVGGHEVAMYSAAGAHVATISVATGDTLNLNAYESGEYKFKIRSFANNDNLKQYGNSAWSDAVDFTWTNESAPQIANQGTNASEDFVKQEGNANKWALFAMPEATIREGTTTNNDELDTTITVDYTGGGQFWHVQLFRNITKIGENDIDAAKSYKLSFDIVATYAEGTESGVIQYNKTQTATLTNGVKQSLECTYAAGSTILMHIAFGEPTGNTPIPGKYVISNIRLTEVAEQGGEQTPDQPAE